MDRNKLKITSVEADVFSLLCLRAGEKLSQREIAKILTVSPTAIGNVVKKLIGKKLVTIEKTRNIHLVSLNRNEPQTIQLKRVENLKMIYLSGLADHLEEQLAGATIILFGSYTRGEDTKTSDIDIAVIGRKEKTIDTEKFRKMLHRPISIQFYESWKIIHKHLRNNILNGIILYGSVEL